MIFCYKQLFVGNKLIIINKYTSRKFSFGDGYKRVGLFPRKLCIFAFGYGSRCETECCLKSNELRALCSSIAMGKCSLTAIRLGLCSVWSMHKPRNFVSWQVWYQDVCLGNPQMSRSRDNRGGAVCKHSLKIIPDHDDTYSVYLNLTFFCRMNSDNSNDLF